jgi:hypothetical protein
MVLDIRASFSSQSSPYQNLDLLYWQVLQTAVQKSSEQRLLERFRTVLSAMVLLYDALSAGSLGHLLKLETRVVLSAS